MNPRCSFTGAGWYRMLWRGARDPAGTTRVVWIAELEDLEQPDLLGVWHEPAVIGDPMLAIARIKRVACDRNLVSKIGAATR